MWLSLLNLGKIKDIVTTLSVVVAIITSLYAGFEKQNKDKAVNNLYKKEVQWKDAKGRLVTEVTELNYTTSELRRASASDSTLLSNAEKKLYDASKRIKELGIKLNNVASYNKAEFEVKNDSMVSYIQRDSLGVLKGLKTIKTDNLTIDFNVQKDTVLVSSLYKANMVVVINRKEDYKTKKGNRRLFLARWVNPRYRYWATTEIDDPKAKITTDTYINFKNKRK